MLCRHYPRTTLCAGLLRTLGQHTTLCPCSPSPRQPPPGTMKTSMDHPVRGPTQLFRRDLSEGEHHSVLNNPRQHTGKGYYKK